MRSARLSTEEPKVSQLQYRVPAVERTMAIMEYLSVQSGPQRLADISANVAVAKSTCLTLLSTLERCGYVERDAAACWSMTLKAYTVGTERIRRLGWLELARDHVARLQSRSRLTAHLGVLDRGEVVYVLKSTAPGLVGFNTYPGFRAHLHLTALGRAICSSLSREERSRVLQAQAFTGGTANAPKSREAFEAILEGVTARGFAMELEEEEEGVGCIAAPVRSPGSNVVAAVGVTALAVQLRDRIDEIGRLVVEAAEDVTEAVAHSVMDRGAFTVDGHLRPHFPEVAVLSRADGLPG